MCIVVLVYGARPEGMHSASGALVVTKRGDSVFRI